MHCTASTSIRDGPLATLKPTDARHWKAALALTRGHSMVDRNERPDSDVPVCGTVYMKLHIDWGVGAVQKRVGWGDGHSLGTDGL